MLELFFRLREFCRTRLVSGTMSGAAFSASGKVAFVLWGLLSKYHVLMAAAVVQLWIVRGADRQAWGTIVLTMLPVLAITYFTVMGWQFKSIYHEADWRIRMMRVRPGRRV